MGMRRQRVRRALGPAIAIGAVLLAFAVGGVMIALLGASPWESYAAMIDGAFGGREELATTAVRATPLLLVAAGICIAFRARVINIGGEGQIIAGALASTVAALALPDLPSGVLIPLVLLAGCLGGGIWGGVPGALKGYLGVNEILSTIMLNIVAVQLMSFLLRSALIDPAEIERGTRIPQTERLSPNADLPIILTDTRLHLGVVIAVVAAVAAWVLLWRTTLGYRIRAVGAGPDAARYAGIPVARMTTVALAISGALCGLAGAVLVFGSESHRLVTDGSSTGFTGSSGFSGIVAALFGGLHPLASIPASFLFGGLLVGANAMQRATQIPASLAIVINGLVVLFVVSSVSVRQRLRRRLDEAVEAPAAGPAPAGPASESAAAEPREGAAPSVEVSAP